MYESKLIPEANPHLFEAPIPGQSLTNSLEEPYPWEGAPEITSQKEALNKIFLEIIKPDNIEVLGTAMSDGIPVAGLAEVLIKTSFQKGKINPDLAITLMEPVMYILLSVAEKIGVDPVLSDDEEKETYDSDKDNIELNKANTEVIKNQEATSLKELPRRAINIPTADPQIEQQIFFMVKINQKLILQIEQQINELDTSKIQASILQKKQPQAQVNQSLLNKEGVK